MTVMGRIAAAALAAALLAACGRKETQADAPLAFVPADAPYVFANAEPLPDAVIAQFSRAFAQFWPILIDMQARTLERATAAAGAAPPPLLRAAIEELRPLDTLDKWRQAGFDPKARAAFYGVGIAPVLRFELSDPAALRALVDRIGQRAGAPLAASKIGRQEVWTAGDANALVVLAIEGRQFVATLLPGGADEALKRRALGLDRPAQSLAATGALAGFDRAHGYRPYGSGWIDTRRLLALLLERDDVRAALARRTGAAGSDLDAQCRAELDGLAANVPRLATGYTALEPGRFAMDARIELAPALAAALGRLGGQPPGAPAPEAAFEAGLATPVLALRDFAAERLDAIAAAPFRCPALASLNDVAAFKAQLGQTIPPPLADLTGVRLTLTRLAWPEGAATPDVAGRLVVGTRNPGLLLNLAQAALPALRGLALAPGAPAVALPPDLVPPSFGAHPPLYAAVGGQAIGVALGAAEAAPLPAALSAPAADRPGTLFGIDHSGAFYGFLADMLPRLAAKMPSESRGDTEGTSRLYRQVAQWYRHVDVRLGIEPDALVLRESGEFATP